MNWRLFSRLTLDFLGAGLMVLALAYDWLGNTIHEVVGTGMFVLMIVHNVLNRRWYGTIAKRRREVRRTITTAINLALLMAMLALLISSLMISRVVFAFLFLDGDFMARQIHTLAAYWALIFVAIHLGMHWMMVMSAARSLFGITGKSAVRTAILRVLAVTIAAYGVQSSFAMSIGSKLILYFTFDFWDFREEAVGFFLHYMSIIGLYVFIAHYLGKWLWRRRNAALKADAPAQ